ncbi:sugar phosphate isomerase/epimerase family protein [Membranihabitans marinus]|uniref:sugar phosphate isomerase/epimerase family protein n=1 Tax=Membranihabitans marinus TaxID=1227546 RepID=UPI001F1DB66E|nr:sugar phosphate isomerase/epimerase family protein [Membranihabitans marinus]
MQHIKTLTITIILIIIIQPFSQAQDISRQRLKTSLNAYSFHKDLINSHMNIEDLLQFCHDEGFDAVDLTGYYFKSYPLPPHDSILFQVKRSAFAKGLAFSGTGIRTDFTSSDIQQRRANIDLVKQWIKVAAKLGAPVLRIFAGKSVDDPVERQKVLVHMISDLRECIDYAKSHGIILGLQNHNEFLKNSAQVIEIMEALPSPWLGLVLDIGSYRQGQPYPQIIETIPYAVNWQLKENMYIDQVEVKTDLNKILSIILNSKYRGYIPIETLGPGHAPNKIHAMIEQVNMILKSNK